MSNQIIISSGAKVRNLNGVLTGTSGIVDALGINVPSGIPQLDSNGKILVNQLPNSVMEYKGTWNVTTNTPTLVNGTGNTGDVYLVEGAAVGGTSHDFGDGPITFYNGDQVVYSGSIWQRASGSTGTVTSVAVTESSAALNITGSPITNSGTINIGFAGTSAQYVAGDGSLVTFPTLSGYVPYTGATSNVNLGEYGLSGGFFGFDTTPTGTPTSVGTMAWDSFYRTPSVILGGGNVTLQVGQEEVVLVHNNTGSTLTDGQVVYITGSTGELPSVALATNTTEAASSVTFGIVTESIAHGADGFVTISGVVHGLNTLAFNEGDMLWLGSTAGTFTNVKPTAPANSVLVGYVVKKSGGNGSIFVKIQNGYELEELHDVLITSVANNQGLFWDSASSLWVNKSIAGALGYTPANAATYVPYTGATSNVVLGNASLSGFNLTIEGNSTYGGQMLIKQGTSWYGGGSGYTSIYAYLNNIVIAPTTAKFAYLNFGSISDGLPRTYTFPDATGTIALTSDIPSLTNYATLNTIQTFTAQKTFNADVFLNYGATIINADLSFQNSGFELGLNATTLTANRVVTLQDKAGTIALLSDIPSGIITGSGTTNYVARFSGTNAISNGIIYDNGTSVIIGGTTAGSGKLLVTSSTSDNHIQINGSAPSLRLTNNPTGATINGFVAMSAGADNYIQTSVSGDMCIGNQNNGSIMFGFGSGTATPKWKLLSSGRMLLNGSADDGSTTLQVAGSGKFSSSVTASGDIYSLTTTNGTASVKLGTSNTTRLILSSSDLTGDGLINVIANHNLTLQTNSSDRLTITGSGNVGIGTSSPDAALHVIAGTNTNGARIIGNGVVMATYLNNLTNNNTILRIDNYNSNFWDIQNNVSDNSLTFDYKDAERLRLTSGGGIRAMVNGGGFYSDGTNNLFVGTDGSSNGICVFDAFSPAFRPYNNGSTDLGSSGNRFRNIYYTGSFNPSDRRLKNSIEDSSLGLDFIMQLNPKQYKYNVSYTKAVPLEDGDIQDPNCKEGEKLLTFAGQRTHFGLIAQEVKEVLPSDLEFAGWSLADKDNADSDQALNYMEFIAPLIKAIQEQQTQIEELKALIAAK